MEQFIVTPHMIAEYGALVVIAAVFIIMSVLKDKWIMNKLTKDLESQESDLDEVLDCLRKSTKILWALSEQIDRLIEGCPHVKKGGADDDDNHEEV